MTILFADIVGSTTLAERLGPDDWSELLGRVHARLGPIVEAHGGTVGQILGDGLLAMFGTPRTHEDDPLRAVEAGLDMVEAVRAAGTGEVSVGPGGLALRVGIATGVVVVGDLRSASHAEHLALGDAVNVAARIQELAAPMTVVVSQETERLVAGSIEARDGGEHELKGRSGRVRTFEVLGLRTARERRRRLPLLGTSLVGREAELSRLRTLSSQLRAGGGGIVTVLGEPGIGKSRLLAEWREQTALPWPDPTGDRRRAGASRVAGEREDQIAWVEVRCAPHDQHHAYRVVADLVRELAGVTTPRAPVIPGEDFRAAVSRIAGDRAAEVLPYLGHLLAEPLEPAEAASVAELDPRALQVHIGRATAMLLAAAAELRPLVTVIEDIQWIDSSSSALLAHLLPLTVEAPILVCLTSRPEPGTAGAALLGTLQEAAWPDACALALEPLSMAQTAELLGALLPGAAVAGRARELILGRAEGNPLFVEEIVRALLDRGELVRDPQTWTIQMSDGEDVIPLTLHGLLLARIGRLPDDTRAVLRIAAVIGRRFPVSTLAELGASIAGLRRSAVTQALERLVVAGLVEAVDPAERASRAERAEPGYAFRHALIAEAAYDEIVRTDRAAMHLAVARALEHDHPEHLQDLAPALARHYRLAGDTPRAVAYLERGARRAAERFANLEAAALLEEALELAAGTPGVVDDAEFAGLHELLGDIHYRAGDQDAALRRFALACEARPAADAIGRARAWRKAGATRSLSRFNFPVAFANLDEAQRLLESADPGRGQDWWCEWIDIQVARSWTCYLANAPELADLIERAREPVRRWGTAAQRSELLGGKVMLDLRTSRYRLGPDEVATARESLEAAEESGNLRCIAEARLRYGFAQVQARQLEGAERSLEASIRLAERIAEPVHECRARSYLTVISRLRRDPEEVRLRLERQVLIADVAGLSEYVAAALASRAWLALLDGDDSGAAELAHASLTRSRALSHGAYPFEWLALWPLLAVQLRRDDLGAAAESARELLQPPQQVLEPPVPGLLEAAIAAWDRGDAAVARTLLDSARHAAVDAGYL